MKSHTCEFEPKDLLRRLAMPLLPMAVFAALMHAGALVRLLPAPRPTLDIDRTLLVHQAEASRARHDADVLLLGDSSCLMDVDAKQLGDQLGRPALNLGTLSYLDLNAAAALLRRSVVANPDRLRAVVLLLHPEALRRTSPEAYHVAVLKNFLDGEDFMPGTTGRDRLSTFLGLEIFRARLLARVLPTPLPGAYGRRYGFSAELERHLTEHHGSAIDPDPQPFKGSAEYRLAPQLEAASRAFRAAVPAGVKLFVGITPAPEGFVRANHRQLHSQMLRDLSGWLQAEPLELPAELPDHFFVKTTHLSEAGACAYTELLARQLEARLR